MNEYYGSHWESFVLENFSLIMLVVAVLFMLLHRAIKKNISQYEIVYRWTALFALGIAGIYAFVMHAFFPILTSANIGWASSPFQFEVAIANLAFGILAILSFNASYNFRLATVIGSTIWLWGDALGHIHQIIKLHNFTVGNAGSWFWMDILIPLILIICISKMRYNPIVPHVIQSR